jgi:hypothetical protein
MRVQVMHDAKFIARFIHCTEPSRACPFYGGAERIEGAKGHGGRTPRRIGESSWPSREHSCVRRGRGETSFPVLVPRASRDSSCVPRLLGDGRLFGAARPGFAASRRKCALATPPVCGVGTYGYPTMGGRSTGTGVPDRMSRHKARAEHGGNQMAYDDKQDRFPIALGRFHVCAPERYRSADLA